MTRRREPTVGELRRAIAYLQRSEFLRVLEELGPCAATSPVVRSLMLAARGLLSEQAGETKEAARCFDQVFELAVPLPALLLVAGRYFHRTHQFDRAYECCSLSSQFRPGEFLDGLPPRELSRYAPFLIGARPGHWRLQPVKAALARELGATAAAIAYAQMDGYTPGFTVRRMTVTPMRDYARRHGLEYDEIVAGREVVLPATPVFGAPRADVLAPRTRTMFLCRLGDAIVSSESSLVLCDNHALLDVQDDELERFPLDLDLDPVVFGGDDGTEPMILIAERALSSAPLERAFALTGVATVNFGHWIIEYLPKVLACLDRPGFSSTPIIVDARMPTQHRESLRLVIGDAHPLIVLEHGDAVLVNDLWVCSAIAYLPFAPTPGHDPPDDVLARTDYLRLDAAAFVELFETIRTHAQAVTGERGPSRIYLARKDSQHRRLVNRTEVEAWFESRGFAIVDFGTLAFDEQLRLVRNADIIVGPDGSANFMTLFAPRGTRIGILNNTFAEDCEWYAAACQELGQALLILTGRVVERDVDFRTFSSYEIDVGQLPAYLDALDSLPAGSREE